MACPLRIEYEGAFYHVIQRGIERRDIFISDNDKQKFLSYLDFAHTGYSAIIHTYILMDNHYHLVLETPRGNLSKIMHYLNASYAAYYNVITPKEKGWARFIKAGIKPYWSSKVNIFTIFQNIFI